MSALPSIDGARPRRRASGRALGARETAALVFRTEMRGLLRDRRALFSAVILPILLYPFLFTLNTALERAARESLSSRPVRVEVDLASAPEDLAARLREALLERAPLDLADFDATRLRELAPGLQEGGEEAQAAAHGLAREAFDERDAHLLVASVPHPVLSARTEILVAYDGSSDESNEALRRARAALEALERDLGTERLERLLGAGDPARGLDLVSVDVASSRDKSGDALGKLLPLLAALVLVSGGAYAALSAFAGEREAQTLETLLVQPAPARGIALGKLAAVVAIASAALLGNVGSLLASLALGLGTLPGVEGHDGAPAFELIGAGRLLLGALTFLPTAVLLCTVLVLISSRAQTFREGQQLLFPLTIVVAVGAGFAGAGDVAFDHALAAVPLLGPCLALRDALRGQLAWAPTATLLVASSLWAALALSALPRALESERLVQGGRSEEEAAQRSTQSRAALGFGLAAVILTYVAGGWLQARWPLWGLLATLWILLPALAILCARGTARRAKESLAAALALRAPRAAHALGALLCAPLLAWLVRELVPLQQRWLPLPAHMLEAADKLAFLEKLSLPALLAVTAISPGVCEELFFRGALLGGLRRDLPAWKALAWQALFFGAAHASIYRLLPSGLVGLALGLVALRARSLWPCVLLHAAYDGLIVASSRHEALADPRLAWLALPGLVLLLARRPPAASAGRSPGPRRPGGP